MKLSPKAMLFQSMFGAAAAATFTAALGVNPWAALVIAGMAWCSGGLAACAYILDDTRKEIDRIRRRSEETP